MAFRTADFRHLAKFNSAASAEFLSMYWNTVDAGIKADANRPKSQCIAPSGLYCPLQQWFRLRGTQPDTIEKPDRVLQFSANVGTACHEMIQKRLIDALGSDWIDPARHLESINPMFTYSVESSGYETRVSIEDPPIRFAVDGILNWKDKRRLLEIKTSEFSSFDNLYQPKPGHVDQIRCYATLLNLPDVLMMYVDRQYGDVKCFEVTISDEEMKATWDKINNIVDYYHKSLAPEGLPKGDSRCGATYCPYYKTCKSWRM